MTLLPLGIEVALVSRLLVVSAVVEGVVSAVFEAVVFAVVEAVVSAVFEAVVETDTVFFQNKI